MVNSLHIFFRIIGKINPRLGCIFSNGTAENHLVDFLVLMRGSDTIEYFKKNKCINFKSFS